MAADPEMYRNADTRCDAHQEASATARRLAAVEQKLQAAMTFVPHPKEMSGYGDPSAPEECLTLVRLAAELHGVELST